MSREREYLGDGIYASFDGIHIWLHLSEDPDSDEPSIALHEQVFESLLRYADTHGPRDAGWALPWKAPKR